MTFWLAYKMLFGNIKRAIFPFLGVLCGVISLIMTLSLGAGGESIINTNLSAIGDNRIMIGGNSFNQRDIRILENYPFVEYALFPKARSYTDDNIYIGYPERVFDILDLPHLNDREVIVDKNQFENVKVGDTLELSIGTYRDRFLIKGLYEEKNPLELMRKGNRIIVSQDTYERIFGERNFSEIVISFEKGEDAEEYIPIILNKFRQDRGLYGDIQLLETPEVYKRIEKIKNIVSMTLGILSVISLGIGGLGIMNLIGSNIRARTGHMGILRAMGMSSKDMVIMFITEGVIISFIGSIVGLILGIIFSVLVGKVINIYPVFSFGDIFISLVISLIVGVIMVTIPAIKAGEKNTIELLREI